MDYKTEQIMLSGTSTKNCALLCVINKKPLIDVAVWVTNEWTTLRDNTRHVEKPFPSEMSHIDKINYVISYIDEANRGLVIPYPTSEIYKKYILNMKEKLLIANGKIDEIIHYYHDIMNNNYCDVPIHYFSWHSSFLQYSTGLMYLYMLRLWCDCIDNLWKKYKTIPCDVLRSIVSNVHIPLFYSPNSYMDECYDHNGVRKYKIDPDIEMAVWTEVCASNLIESVIRCAIHVFEIDLHCQYYKQNQKEYKWKTVENLACLYLLTIFHDNEKSKPIMDKLIVSYLRQKYHDIPLMWKKVYKRTFTKILGEITWKISKHY